MTTTARKNRKPVSRTCRLGGNVLTITVNGESTDYRLTPDGDGYRLGKLSEQGADADYKATADGCDCPGGKYHGHCKHRDAIRALAAAGKLPKPAPAGKPACQRCGGAKRVTVRGTGAVVLCPGCGGSGEF